MPRNHVTDLVSATHLTRDPLTHLLAVLGERERELISKASRPVTVPRRRVRHG